MIKLWFNVANSCEWLFFQIEKIWFVFLNILGPRRFYEAFSEMSCSCWFLLDYVAVRELLFLERLGIATYGLEIAATGEISGTLGIPKRLWILCTSWSITLARRPPRDGLVNVLLNEIKVFFLVARCTAVLNYILKHTFCFVFTFFSKQLE